jgi:outer membrane protein OmpA-like peptidoglycan-associated protein
LISNSTLERRGGLLAAVLSLAVAALLVALPAQAQRSFYLDRVQFGGAPDDGLVTRRAYLAPETRVYGSTALAYVLNPLRASTVAVDEQIEERIENLVEQQLLSYFSAGIEIGQRFAFGLTVPVAWVQSGGDVPIPGSRPPTPSLFPIDTGSALYDVSLEARWLIHNDAANQFRIGAGGAIFVPAGTFSRGGSDNRTTFYLYGALEKGFGPLLFAGSIGPHFRPLRGIDGTDSRLDLGNELRVNAAAFFDLFERFRIGGEINGMVGFAEDENGDNTFFEPPATPWEWLGSGRLLLGSDQRTYARASVGTRFTNGYGAPDLRVMISIGRWVTWDDLMPEDTTHVRFQGRHNRPEPPPADKDSDGDGFPDSIDVCPDLKEDGEEPYPGDGCPVTSDRDGDGIVDLQDKCPDDPEDIDHLQDTDGCPEKDADSDGVLDVRDACPLVPGMEQGDPKRDGCSARAPQKLVVEADKGELRLLEPVQFETGTAEIKPASYPLLDEVVGVMTDGPDIRIAVYGHTDSRGSAAYNKELSLRRARAVVKYLMDKGISPSRLEAQGFGPDRPIASNDTDAGRASNRRVEFKILEQGEGGSQAKPSGSP